SAQPQAQELVRGRGVLRPAGSALVVVRRVAHRGDARLGAGGAARQQDRERRAHHPRAHGAVRRGARGALAAPQPQAGPGPAGAGTAGDIRFAVNQANASPGSTITFDTAHSGALITLSHGELAITASVTLTGPGAAALTISGSSGATSSRVFDVTSSAAVVAIK